MYHLGIDVYVLLVKQVHVGCSESLDRSGLDLVDLIFLSGDLSVQFGDLVV